MSFAPARSHSQNPAFVTHPALHIRDAHDAHVVLEAVRQNVLPLIKRRLLASERDQLQSGHVYVWEEAQDDGGLLRWTDGRRWSSQSRMRGDYLFYEEKIETTQEERDAKAARRACRASDPNAAVPPPIRRKDRPSKPNGLTKQTYSVTVHLPGTNEIRKWHVVAYFSGSDYSRLPVIEHYDYLRNIRVPNGVFISNKNLCGKPDRPSYASDEEFYDDTPPALVYAHRPPSSGNLSPVLSTAKPASPYSPVLHAPYPGSKLSLPPINSLSSPSHELRKPVLPDPRGNIQQHSGSSSMYSPLSSEDRRALEKFRVVL